MPMWNFLFQLPNVKILDKKRIFAVKNKQKGKYVEKQCLVSKTLIQFLNKATCNSMQGDKKFPYLSAQRCKN